MYPNETVSTDRDESGRLEIVVVRREGETDAAYRRRIKRALRSRSDGGVEENA